MVLESPLKVLEFDFDKWARTLQTGAFWSQSIYWCHWNWHQTDLPWQRKFGNFNTKLARTWLIQEIEPRMLHQTGFSKSSNFTPTLKFTADHSMATKMWKFQHKISHNSANIRRSAKNVAPVRGYQSCAIYLCHRNLPPINPGGHGNKNWGILTQN